MSALFTSTLALLNVAGSPKSPDANLSFIEIESRLREKIRVNAAELRQVRYFQLISLKQLLQESVVWKGYFYLYRLGLQVGRGEDDRLPKINLLDANIK